ncbi:MAG: hypothetical protein GX226_05600 [Dehalococcoidales bacterium]|nr:hypothetical protein [Dehalococcoidales bacterium]
MDNACGPPALNLSFYQQPTLPKQNAAVFLLYIIENGDIGNAGAILHG